MNPTSTNEKYSFTEVNLLDLQRKKEPKRLVYFSDGILEEYSTDDDELDCKQESQPLVDPKTLEWLPYFGYMLWLIGSRTLSICDYLGENLAWLFGITSPKFQYELDQFEKMAKEEEELEKRFKDESAGWISDSSKQEKKTVAQQPEPSVLQQDERKMKEIAV